MQHVGHLYVSHHVSHHLVYLHVGYHVHFHVGHHVHLHVGHHVHLHVHLHVGHHVDHHNVVSTLCEDSETLTECKSESITYAYGRTDGLTVCDRDACVSKNKFRICFLSRQPFKNTLRDCGRFWKYTYRL